jgi:hypothetical protein
MPIYDLRKFDNALAIVAFFSPYIVMTFFTLLSLYYGSFQGFMYLAYTIFSLLVRRGIYSVVDAPPKNENSVCDAVDYYGDKLPAYISLWVFFHTLGYIILPISNTMSKAIQKGSYSIFFSHFIILLLLLLYIGFDIHIKNKMGECFKDMKHIGINTMCSFWLSFLFVISMTYASESSKKIIYFNDTVNIFSSDSKCNRVAPTKFQCSA